MQDVETRFWSKVNKNGDCWLWTAGKTRNGYGQFHASEGDRRAHRVSYEWANGPVPQGMFLDHICRVRDCVNPAHLRIVTKKQNAENRVARRGSRSGVRGVTWNKRDGKWYVQVMHEGRHYYGGSFADLSEAEAKAIDLRNRLFTHNDTDL